jgi:hypothetical protein
LACLGSVERVAGRAPVTSIPIAASFMSIYGKARVGLGYPLAIG